MRPESVPCQSLYSVWYSSGPACLLFPRRLDNCAAEKICVHLLDANIRLRPLPHVLIFNIFKLKLSYFRTRDAVQSMCVQVIICGNVGSVKEKESVLERFRIKLVNASIIEVGLK